MFEPDREEELDFGDYWSYSKLTSIFECGKEFWFDYIKRSRKSKGSALRFGTVVHSCLELMHTDSIWQDGDVQRLWADTWIPIVDQIDWSKELLTPRVYKNRGLKMLEQYASSHKADEILELERKFKFKGDVTLGGIIDKIKIRNGKPAIVDYKTSKWAPDPLVLRADHQLTIYYMAAKELGYPTDQLAIHNLLDGTEYWTTRTDADVVRLMDTIHEAQKKIEHKMYERNIGFHCRMCPFKVSCLGGIGDQQDTTRELPPPF